MHIKIKQALLLIFTLVLTGCDVVDISGLLISSSVAARFRKSSVLWPVTAPAVSDEYEFSFLVVTDSHYYTEDPRIFEKIEAGRYKWGIEFVVITGDITQSGTQEQYDLFSSDRSRYGGAVRCIPGNHDIYNDNEKNYFKNLGPGNYSFNIGNSLFMMLDTANGTLGKHQLAWYEDLLARSTAENIFVFSHYSLFDEGVQSSQSWPCNEEKYALIALNSKYGIDYFLSGHLHRYRETIVDDVRYIMLNDLVDDNENTMMKINVSDSALTHSLVE